MTRKQHVTQTSITLLILFAMILPTALIIPSGESVDTAGGHLQPLLAEMALADPDQQVRVIVQKTGNSDVVERMVADAGGTVIKDLGIINAFAALLPTRVAADLSQMAAVNWVSLDPAVISTGRPGTTAEFELLDTFVSGTFSGNDGLASWNTDWIEEDVAGAGPDAGNVSIYTAGGTGWGDGSELRLADNPDTGTQPSAAREADLSYGVVSATLSYAFRVGPGVDIDEDLVVLEVSMDGGATYTILNDFNFNGDTTGSSFRNILEFTSDQTRFRFRVTSGYDGPDEYFAIDNFRIVYEGNALSNYTYLDTLDVEPVWDMGYTGEGIGVAVVDSGISVDRDLNIVARTSFNPNSNTVNDVYGHGTHVAGIIGMNGSDSGGHFLGIAPDVDLISLKISDENGMAYESDTVSAMEWILDHKDQYNIRVVNLSIQSTVEQSYNDSPLAAAAEILWFNGIVVVAATGNWYGGNIYPLNVAPGNDPFVITVGAADEKGTSRTNDDFIPNFSAWGNTLDGFMKPEIFAPGVDIISVLSKDSTWGVEYPEREVFAGQYFRITGTSMATPMVSGAVALLLQAEPNLTPDQVKYRVMNAHKWVGPSRYLNVHKLLTTPTTESANQDIIPHQLLAKMALMAYWSSANGDENIDWDAVNWNAVNWNAVNWNAVNWNAVNWNAVNWNAVNWNAVNWNAVNWNAVNWNAVNWNAVNWNAVNWNAVNWNAVNWNAVNWNASYWLEE